MTLTMTQDICHHLSDDILMGYAAGALPEAFNLMAATHLSLCDNCRAQAGAFDALGGELLDQISRTSPVSMSPDSLQATLARIAAGTEAASRDAAAPTGRGILPGPLRAYVGGDLEAVRWWPVGMGVRQARLKTSRAASARLLFIPAGTAMPEHGHRGTEMTMVLQGAFLDDGVRFGRGDVETADSDCQHTPIADIGEDCVCLAVTDAPLRFDGIVHRIAQKFLRI